MKKIYKMTLLSLVFLPCFLSSQNEARNWYFGRNAGLDFSTSPPGVITNGQLRTDEGCASISNGAGSLLFYTDGVTVYNQTNAVMANGTGLFGNLSTTQSAIIVKKPGSSTIYYIFTLGADASAVGLNYSVVDLSLAAGMGSVTVKNDSLSSPSCEKLTAIRHCNGVDVWVLSHDWNTANFRAYLVTSAGVNTTPVLSTSGSVVSINSTKAYGQMKVSPNGNKLGLTIYNGNPAAIELHDFNASSGIVSNGFALGNATTEYGCEFSPDGTKFYSARLVEHQIFQWDLCAGNNAAIIASQVTINADTNYIGSLQLGPDGKIYVARQSILYQSVYNYLSVINSPNTGGLACNYVDTAILLGPDTCRLGLPNFINSYLKPAPVPTPFTYTAVCSSYTFAAAAASSTNAGCTAVSSSVTGYLWDFGDPASGTANSSTLPNPSHAYPAASSYTAQLVTYYTCSTDTNRITLTPGSASPNISVAGTFTICKGQARVYTASGATSYTWSNSATTASITLSPTVGLVYSVSGTGSNSCVGTKSFTVYVNICTSLEELNEAQLFKIYPNPTSGNFLIETDAPVSLLIFNQLGQPVFEGTFGIGKNNIDFSRFSKGIYSIRAVSGETIRTTRLVKID